MAAGKLVNRFVAVFNDIRRQILHDSLACMNGQPLRSDINEAGQFKGYGGYPQQSLLLAHRIGDVGPGQADPV